MPDQNSIFRKVSLDRLSSPEQLDQKLTVISPIGWAALVSLMALIAAALAWGFFGSVSDKVSSAGMLMYGEGIYTLTAQTGGQISDLSVRAGDQVARGQVIARVSRDDLVKQIEAYRQSLAALEAVDVATLDLDITALNGETYAEFAPLAEQIRAARVQYEAQGLEAHKNEEDLANRQAELTLQASALRQQIGQLESQTNQYEELLKYQRDSELAGAREEDRIRREMPSAYEQAANRPGFDAGLAQMQSQLENLKFQQSSLNSQIKEIGDYITNTPTLDEATLVELQAQLGELNLQEKALPPQIKTLERQIKEYSDLLAYQREIELEEARWQDLQRNAAPSAYEQAAARPDYDPNLASMQSQLTNLKLQLIQTEFQAGQDSDTFASYLWSGHDQTGEHISALVRQFSDLKQIRGQDLRQRLADLLYQYEQDSVITAGFDGSIAELTIQTYDYVQPGSSLGNIIRMGGSGGESSIVVLYVPIDKGKLIHEGMEANISPSTVNREEHGYIIGRVRSVSEYAVTQEHMMATLKNQQLVAAFGAQTAVIEVHVELMLDAATVSGYKWSTPKGAPSAVNPGTVINAEIRVGSRRPIDMVVPFIKSLFST